MPDFATAWRDWSPVIERAALPLTGRMMALGALSEGGRVLDIGTGIGEPAFAAARIVGHSGSVLAIDPDRAMIAIARKAATRDNVRNVTFQVRRAEELELPVGSFDAVLCRWSLMFVDDLKATLARLRRLLRPGGRLVATSWGTPQRVPALSLARWTIHRHFGRPPPPQGPKTAYALADIAALAQAFRAAGFAAVEQERISLTFEFPNPQAYIRFRVDCTGSLFSGIGRVAPKARRDAIQAVEAALAPYRAPDGAIRLANDAYCTMGVASGR